MVRNVVLAATQFACGHDPEENMNKAEKLVRQAATAGAQIILLQELFQRQYWGSIQSPEYLAWAAPLEGNPVVERFRKLAAELKVVLPISFFERANNVFFNAIAVADADGKIVGHYRKSHIPDGPGYSEKFYFSPGDTGFRVFDTAYGRIGVAVCWDQWFPESARALALQGAEVLLFPSAIGSEPNSPINSYMHWLRVQQGHAAANVMPLVACNRVGEEHLPGPGAKAPPNAYYGGSFIAGPQGEVMAQVGAKELVHGHPDPDPALVEGFTTATVDLEAIAAQRAAWGVFRDRRPELYGVLCTLGGSKA